jgi:hypothetical protein
VGYRVTLADDRSPETVGDIRVETFRHRLGHKTETRWRVRCSECGLVNNLGQGEVVHGAKPRRRGPRERFWYPTAEVTSIKQQLHARQHRGTQRRGLSAGCVVA